MPSISGRHYAAKFVDDFTSKTDVYFLKYESDFMKCLRFFKERSKAICGQRLINVRLDGAGENSSTEVPNFCMQHGIRMEFSLVYASQSNGIAETYMQDFGNEN